MATARHLPDVLVDISIAVGGTVSSNAYIKVGSLDSIAFRNNAGFPVNIVFTSTFPEIKNLPNGQTSPAQGGTTSLNITVNYVIQNANTGVQTGGPYAVQFGVGPLTVTITNDNTSPDPIAIPAQGTLVFNSDGKYGISWPGNLWSPQPSTIYQGDGPPANPIMTALAGANGMNVTYTLTPQLILAQGKGTVKIGT
jgi:hypothetical protein